MSYDGCMRSSSKLTLSSYNIAACPSDPLALTNRLVVSPGDFSQDVEFVVLRNKFIFSIM